MAGIDKDDFRHKPLDDNLRFSDVRKEKYIAEHTVSGDDTLSHIALKYYGSAIKEKWMIIYEANKAVIGDDPNKIRPGLVLKIPELPK